MNVLLIEDEQLSADRLIHLLTRLDSQIKIVDVVDSVTGSVAWFKNNNPPDLVFLDIELSDGTGFDILSSANYGFPVIFTTAFDNYAIKAFKFNSIDYLLKPIDAKELKESLTKFKTTLKADSVKKDKENFGKLKKLINNDFKKRFLIKIGDRYKSLSVENVSYFYYHNSICSTISFDNKKYPLDYTLDQLENILNPLQFFRINRQLLIDIRSIQEIHSYFNSRLLIDLKPQHHEEAIVSRERVAEFKQWMDI